MSLTYSRCNSGGNCHVNSWTVDCTLYVLHQRRARLSVFSTFLTRRWTSDQKRCPLSFFVFRSTTKRMKAKDREKYSVRPVCRLLAVVLCLHRHQRRDQDGPFSITSFELGRLAETQIMYKIPAQPDSLPSIALRVLH
jgi:hypothetical protein